MDLNLTVLCGRLATEPELRELASGSRLLRLLVTVHSESPERRIDVVPVNLPDPSDELLGNRLPAGTRVWITGSVQRRIWDAPDGCRSRIEVVAEQVAPADEAWVSG